MQLIVAGTTSDNRSAVLRRTPLSERASAALWSTTESPPEVDRPTSGRKVSTKVGPGHTSWGLNYIPPHTVREHHRTDLVSYNVMLSGVVELTLDAERVRLDVGDCLVLLGAMHGWETGSEGALFSYMGIGLEPS